MSKAEKEVDRLESLHALLSEDTHTALRAAAEHDNPYARRTLVRTLFAQIEGTLFAMKCLALGREHDTPGVFTAGELALLREESYDLTDNGEAKTRPANLRFLSNLRFAFESVAKAYLVAYEPPYGEEGWNCLRQALAVRNRLMHPKTPTDLAVSDAEVEQLRKASAWFISSRNALIKAAAHGHPRRGAA